jgi:hypothetical protein
MVKLKKLLRLAHLESHPIRKPEDLIDWYNLRRWVLKENLLDEYQDQAYFKRMEEITVVQALPDKPNIFKRMFHRLFRKIKLDS